MVKGYIFNQSFSEYQYNYVLKVSNYLLYCHQMENSSTPISSSSQNNVKNTFPTTMFKYMGVGAIVGCFVAVSIICVKSLIAKK